jgi:uracil-DNA glycosylase
VTDHAVAMSHRHFEQERARRVDRVFEQHPDLLYDHRETHPWLTGALGDPFAGVWFVAENPSLRQVERATLPTEESQWFVSRGDRLLRDLLVKHGFNNPPWDAPGGWRCYLTNVIKSADRAGRWNKTVRATQLRTAEAWAPVLAWELQQGRAQLVVALGRPAERFLTRFQRQGLLPALPARHCIPHYSYVAMRPRGSLGPMHPQRVAEYDQQFAEIAARAAPHER